MVNRRTYARSGRAHENGLRVKKRAVTIESGTGHTTGLVTGPRKGGHGNGSMTGHRKGVLISVLIIKPQKGGRIIKLTFGPLKCRHTTGHGGKPQKIWRMNVPLKGVLTCGLTAGLRNSERTTGHAGTNDLPKSSETEAHGLFHNSRHSAASTSIGVLAVGNGEGSAPTTSAP